MKAIDFTVSEHNSVSIVFIFGKLDLSSIANEKWFRIPEPLHFGIKSEQRLPSSKESKGGIMAQGISSIISSLFNMVPNLEQFLYQE